MEHEDGWARRLANGVGRRVAYLREQAIDEHGRKMTAQVLADRTASLGHPMDRSVIAKLEKGHRTTITAPELIVLAAALQVHPVELIFPIGVEDDVEILPGLATATWQALAWFTGEAPLGLIEGPGQQEHPQVDDLGRWVGNSGWTGTRDGVGTVGLFRRHARHLAEWMAALTRAASRRHAAEKAATDHDRSALISLGAADEQAARGAEDGLRDVRQQIRKLGLKPPQLPSSLSNLDNGDAH